MLYLKSNYPLDLSGLRVIHDQRDSEEFTGVLRYLGTSEEAAYFFRIESSYSWKQGPLKNNIDFSQVPDVTWFIYPSKPTILDKLALSEFLEVDPGYTRRKLSDLHEGLSRTNFERPEICVLGEKQIHGDSCTASSDIFNAVLADHFNPDQSLFTKHYSAINHLLLEPLKKCYGIESKDTTLVSDSSNTFTLLRENPYPFLEHARDIDSCYYDGGIYYGSELKSIVVGSIVYLGIRIDPIEDDDFFRRSRIQDQGFYIFRCSEKASAILSEAGKRLREKEVLKSKFMIWCHGIRSSDAAKESKAEVKEQVILKGYRAVKPFLAKTKKSKALLEDIRTANEFLKDPDIQSFRSRVIRNLLAAYGPPLGGHFRRMQKHVAPDVEKFKQWLEKKVVAAKTIKK